MNFELDERVKHRLIGLAVIISLAAIFAPAMMKKTNQHFDNEIGMRVLAPPKPHMPEVVVSDKVKLFKTIKVAHVKLPEPSSVAHAEKEKQIPLEAMAKNFVTPVPKFEKEPLVEIAVTAPEKVVITPQPQKLVVKPAPLTVKKPTVLALNQEVYSVQVASFARQHNAQVLVNRLRTKGFVGKIVKIPHKNGDQFKVYVGKSNQKEQALKLKNQLAVALQLNGFIVSGVG